MALIILDLADGTAFSMNESELNKYLNRNDGVGFSPSISRRTEEGLHFRSPLKAVVTTLRCCPDSSLLINKNLIFLSLAENRVLETTLFKGERQQLDVYNISYKYQSSI
jgi:hypothetical protein